MSFVPVVWAVSEGCTDSLRFPTDTHQRKQKSTYISIIVKITSRELGELSSRNLLQLTIRVASEYFFFFLLYFGSKLILMPFSFSEGVGKARIGVTHLGRV